MEVEDAKCGVSTVEVIDVTMAGRKKQPVKGDV